MSKIATAAPADEPGDRDARQNHGRKRANGEGTISARKDGRYEVKAYVLTTAGRLQRKSAYARSYEEARKKAHRIAEQFGPGRAGRFGELDRGRVPELLAKTRRA